MDVRFADERLCRLAEDAAYSLGFDRAVERKYRQRIGLIAAARDERDFYALKSLHYEKLRGRRHGQRSMRLNRQWRLILRIEEEEGDKIVVILGIEDYH